MKAQATGHGIEYITLPNGMNCPTGTVSHAKLRSCDVIPALALWADYYAHDAYMALLERYEGDQNAEALIDGDKRAERTDTAEYLSEDLFDLIDDAMPEGFTFCAHPGDGSDFGIWPIELFD